MTANIPTPPYRVLSTDEIAGAFERLVGLQRRATRYEIAAHLPATGESFLLGYVRGVTRQNLLDLFWKTPQPVGTELVDRAGITDDDPMDWNGKAGAWVVPGKLLIGKTGRTERGALMHGELPRAV